MAFVCAERPAALPSNPNLLQFAAPQKKAKLSQNKEMIECELCDTWAQIRCLKAEMQEGGPFEYNFDR